MVPSGRTLTEPRSASNSFSDYAIDILINGFGANRRGSSGFTNLDIFVCYILVKCYRVRLISRVSQIKRRIESRRVISFIKQVLMYYYGD